MAYKNLLDMHTHSDNSHDGLYSATFMCESAVNVGLRAMAITDHFDCEKFEEFRLARSVRQSMFAIKKAQAAFAGKLIIIAGIELGQVWANEAAASLALSYGFDFVLGSMHAVPGHDDFYYLDYSLPENDPDRLMKEYFEALKGLSAEGDFDSLAHLTYPMRYIRQRCDKFPDMADFKDDIRDIYKNLIARGKALEINTSDLHRNFFETVPSKELIAFYKECGGKLITIGSDAHDFKNIGKGIAEAMDIAKECGFENVCLYQNRSPMEIPII